MTDSATVIATLAGVLVGFFLGQVTEWYKSQQRSTIIKRALLNELSVVHDVISRASQKSDGGSLEVPLCDVPFITSAYDSLRPEVAGRVKVETLGKLQAAYRFIPKMNQSILPIDEEANNFGYVRRIGSDSYYYPETYVLKVDEFVKDAIEALKKELDC